MNPITKIVGTLRTTANHPMNRNRKLKAVLEYGFIQLASRIAPGDICVEFPNNTRLLVSPHMKGAHHYITPRLNEFEDMSFVMHYLRPDELFVDVGANIGAFSILAAGVSNARVIAFEPSPDTFQMLARNIRLNGFDSRVKAINAAVGRSEGTTQFTVGLGTENCVADKNSNNSVTIPMTMLDKELADGAPTVIKVDTEGFEAEVFAGGAKTLRNPALAAIIIERPGLGSSRYGFDEAKLHQEIQQCGFIGCNYEPFERRLHRAGDEVGDLIYVRDLQGANKRLTEAKPFKLGEFVC